MNKYRDYYLKDINISLVGKNITVSGWVNRSRDHGNLLFVDLRDSTSLLQCVVDNSSDIFSKLSKVKNEDVIQVSGLITKRSEDTINPNLESGEVELQIENFIILSSCSKNLPLEVNSDNDYGEEVRLKYRYLDLRRSKMQKNIKLRYDVINHVRKFMNSEGFMELATPILTAPSPEGARDYLVPSRIHKGSFYALPQAPQQFKQLYIASGIDKYFQIAPCFRDEDARADRSPGEFYQLDIEMSFVEQEDVFKIIEKLMVNLFKHFSSKKILHEKFPRIPYEESMKKYGTDKPDLRNPLIIQEVTDLFKREDVKFDIFKKLVKSGSIVRAIITKNTKNLPRSFFDNIDKWAKEQGASGLAYFTVEQDKEIKGKGPVGKFFSEDSLKELMKNCNVEIGDSVFLACGKKREIEKILSLARDKIAQDLDIIDKNQFAFCWIVDYPMYEFDEKLKKITFSHNPFSMPQGDIENLDFDNPLNIKAYQYDIVCNGIELSSGAIRNHKPDLMYKLFSVAGYSKEEVDTEFSGMINAFSYGAPPHGGIAPGIDRIIMLLADEKNIREVTMFPMNQNAQDLMMNAPSEVDDKQLKELNLSLKLKK